MGKNKIKKQKIIILGSTGSIGTQSIDVINTVGDKEIIALACNGNIEKFYEQVIGTGAKYVCIYDEKKAKIFSNAINVILSKKYNFSKNILSISASTSINNKKSVKLNNQNKMEKKDNLNYLNNDGKKYIEFIDKYKLDNKQIKQLKNLKIYTGMNGLIELAKLKEADMVIISVVGMIGIRPTIEAIKEKKIICLANKESLVCAGDIIMPLAKKNKVEIRPIDSEHSAIWQCLQGEEKHAVNKIIITASGGPFYGKKIDELKNVKLEDALKHPNWSMGKKITIDSSTLVNKGLEVMEAHHLFNMPYDKIEVVVQRESLIHSMVEFVDGAIKAQLGVPSMRVPIEYAIYKSNRKFINEKTINWKSLEKISIGVPDLKTFKGLSLAYEAIKEGGLMPSLYNALNEVAVKSFIDGKIKYVSIVDIIEKGMKKFRKENLQKQKFNLMDIENTMVFAENFLEKYNKGTSIKHL